MTDHFFLTLPSNSSMKVFPENKISNFKTQLSKRVSLQGDWEVGLVELHYPCNLPILALGDAYVGYEHIADTNQASIKKAKRSADTDENLIENFDKPQEEEGTRTVRGKFLITDYETFSSTKELIEGLSKNDNFRGMANISVQNSKVYIEFKRHVKKLTFSLKLKHLLGLSSRVLKESSESIVSYSTGPYVPPQMFIYCDVIEPQSVGDVQSPLLRIVCLEAKKYDPGNHAVRIFTHPHYVPLLKKEFDQVEIDIRDDLGKNIPFTHGRLNVKLHFRRVA